MTTFQKTPLKSEIEGSSPLSPGALGYLCARTRDSYFDYVHAKLAEAEVAGLKRGEIAKRIRKSPTRLSHILGAPGNWTLDTITELLAGICREELTPLSVPLLKTVNGNVSTSALLDHHCNQMPIYRVHSPAPIDAQPRYIASAVAHHG